VHVPYVISPPASCARASMVF